MKFSWLGLRALPLLLIGTLLVPLSSAQSDEDTDTELINEFLNGGSSTSVEEEGLSKPGIVSQSPSSSPSFIKGPPKSGSKGQSSEEDKGCECVKYYLCNIDNGTVVDNGDVLGLIDIRLGASKPSVCPHYFDICCPKSKESHISSSLEQDGNTPSTGPPKNFEHSVCGKRNIGGVGFRITGADNMEAQFGEFPWMTAIVRQETQENKPPLNIYLCGGSLIHPGVVLTAAHCVNGKDPEELKVRLGEWDTQTPHELYPHQDRLVTKIVIHEAYYSGALFNDIALLFLSEPVKFAPNIDTICLPPPNLNFDGQTCYASGWGKNSFGQEGKYQVILKKVELPIVPQDQCQRALRRTRLGPHFKLHNSFLCAGGEEGRDTCRGDGGSPLVCQLPDSPHYAQVGIVSWGIGCGGQGTPGVYVNIPLLTPWITEQLKKARMETSFSSP